MSGRLHIKRLNRSLGLGSLFPFIRVITLLLWTPLDVASPQPEQSLCAPRWRMVSVSTQSPLV
jgi:hypothetical protein